MATLIPSYGTCAGRMTPGERRFAQRLEAKLEDDYLCWYDVPVGPAKSHPDFVVLHPRRGLLILEVKDWKPDIIRSMTKSDASILTDRGLKHVLNPLEQARQYAHAVINVLERDKQLTLSSGRMQGRLTFPWAYGVVLANISRRTFESAGLAEVIEPHCVICQDEMTESVEVEAFQRQLWEMFSVRFQAALTLPQLDRVRWHLFPEIRLPAAQVGLFDAGELDSVEIPDLMRVMDLQQEQLARSLGDGHRVIHGVAGSGKTLILGYRAEHLAKVCAKPILVLCYNKTLAGRLMHWMASKGVTDKVHVRTFHSWCHSQIGAYNISFAQDKDDTDAIMAEMVQAVIRGVERGQIPCAQYEAVMIDEGHDFKPEWLKLVVQMIDPHTNSLLILYDDAQSIYEGGRQKSFSFKSVGIQAQGRTTILKVNYRNTQEILEFAAQFATELLKPTDAEEDGVPRLMPISAGRHGKAPVVVKLPTLQAEGMWIAERLKEEHTKGTPWRDMAILYRHYDPVCKTVRTELRKAGIPNTWKSDITFGESQDTVKLLPFHSSKGLEYPIIVIPGAGLLPTPSEATEEDARLLYVAMTRATSQLIVTGA
ncbi:MAG: 3'-5' exonuclease [Sulfuritalea sp.]